MPPNSLGSNQIQRFGHVSNKIMTTSDIRTTKQVLVNNKSTETVETELKYRTLRIAF